jgi:hypothetical protein
MTVRVLFARIAAPQVARELTTEMEKRAFRRVAVVLGSALALTVSLPAAAQQFLSDRGVAQGPGYQAGDFEIHPGIAGEVGYDSNYLLRSDKNDPRYVNASPANPPEGTGELRLTPSIYFRSFATGERADSEARGAPPAVTIAGDVSGSYREFFNSDLSRERNMSANADLILGFLPGRQVSGTLLGSWRRTIQPTVFGDPDLSYNNDAFTGQADLALQPALGTLDWHFGYQFTGILFEDSIAKPYDNMQHMVYTRGRWRFRPRTALLYEGSIASRSYSHPDNAAFALHTSTPVRVLFGMEGLITPRMSLMAMAGYTGLFASRGSGNDPSVQQFDSITANAEVRFFPTQTLNEAPGQASLLVSNIALGFTRQMQASYLNDFVTADRGYLRAMYFFANRVLVTLEGGVGAIGHPDLYFGTGVTGTAQPALMHSAYTDVKADAIFFAEYRVIPSIGINTTLQYDEVFSTAQLPVTVNDVGNATGQFYDQSWRRFQAFIGIRWMM